MAGYVAPPLPFNDWVGPNDPRILSSSAVVTANRTYLMAFSVRSPVTVSTANCEIVTQSGNMAMGIYDASGVRLATTGSVATPVAGLASLALTASITLVPGVRYFAAIQFDNAVAAVAYFSSNAANLSAALALNTFVANTFPLSTPIAITAAAMGRSIGVAFT